MKYCCKEMEQMEKNGDIEIYSSGYFVRVIKAVSLMNQEVLYEFLFCPFCGKKLEE